MRRDLEHRAQLLGESLASNVERDMERSNPAILRRTVQQFANREHLAGLGVYDPQGKTLAVATNLQPLIESAPAVVLQSLKEQREIGGFVRIGIASLHIYAVPLRKGEEVTGSLAIVHDSGYIKGESLRIWRGNVLERAGARRSLSCCSRWLIVRLEHRRADRAHGLLDESSADRPLGSAHQGSRPGPVSAVWLGRWQRSRKACTLRGPPRNWKHACASRENPLGRPTGWRFTSARGWKTAVCSWFRIAEPYIHLRQG